MPAHAARRRLIGVVLAALAGLATGSCAAVMPTWTPSRTATSSTRSSTAPSASATSTATATPSPSLAPIRLVEALIPYDTARQEQMADYALARYGERTWQLTPTAVVLHLTESDDDPRSTIDHFASNTPNDGTLPGVCAHYVVAKDGTVFHLVPTDTMCRHTIGLNHKAIGIEIVQGTEGHDAAWADAQILARTTQVDAVVALVRRLQVEHGIATDRVLGHGTANDDPEFLERSGRRNDHLDIGPDFVAAFRQRLVLAGATP